LLQNSFDITHLTLGKSVNIDKVTESLKVGTFFTHSVDTMQWRH